MKKNIFLLCMTMCIAFPGHADLFDFVSVAVGGVKNLITSGGKTCTPCGTPYNVRCMLTNGAPGDFVPFSIESCFAPLEARCRPTPELMERARQHCSSLGQNLNENAASKEENKRGLVNSQINSTTKAVNGLLPAATAIGGMAIGAVTHDGAVAEAGLNASASLMASQNDAKSIKNDSKALELKKEKFQLKNAPQPPMNVSLTMKAPLTNMPLLTNAPATNTPLTNTPFLTNTPLANTLPTMKAPLNSNSMVNNVDDGQHVQNPVNLVRYPR